jgi:hypothetical protein
MVEARSRRTGDVVRAMREGRAYGVTGRGGAMGIRLKSVETAGLRVTVALDTTAERIEFVGRGGVVRAVRGDTAAASYVLSDDDPYVRIQVTGAGNVLYLNPVFRTDGSSAPAASVDWARSTLLWLAVGLVYLPAVRRLSRWGAAPLAA